MIYDEIFYIIKCTADMSSHTASPTVFPSAYTAGSNNDSIIHNVFPQCFKDTVLIHFGFVVWTE